MNDPQSPDAASAEFLKLYQSMNAFAQGTILDLARKFTMRFPAPKQAPRLKLVNSVASRTCDQDAKS